MVGPPRHALVLGAGLAGAAVCQALASRGWRLQMLDRAAGPAHGASALPVGMLSPHVTRSPTPLSRLSELGVAATRQSLQDLVTPGAGWQDGEVDNLGHDSGRWPAARVRPGALVQAWLDNAAQNTDLQCHWNTAVERLLPHQGLWRALSPQGEVLAEAEAVVVCGAWGSHALLRRSLTMEDADLPLRPVKGQLSFAPLDRPAVADRPQRDKGVFVPEYSDTGLAPRWPQRIWAMGSTYERGCDDPGVTSQAHERNLQSLQALSPPGAQQMLERMGSGELLGWAEVRCASLDRLPLVGAWPDLSALVQLMQTPRRGRLPLAQVPRTPGLFVLTALGSRGLTLAGLCADQLARDMSAEPAALPPDLCAALDPARFAWRRLRRGGGSS